MSVGDFDRVRKSGIGGQASVQLEKSRKDGTLIAVKVFKDPNPACSEKFKVQGQLLEGLQHPCLVKGLGHILPENRGDPAYLLGEFVEGGGLDPSTLDPTEKALILLSIARGIEFLHEKSIVHGDEYSGDGIGNGEVVGFWISSLRRVGTLSPFTPCLTSPRGRSHGPGGIGPCTRETSEAHIAMQSSRDLSTAPAQMQGGRLAAWICDFPSVFEGSKMWKMQLCACRYGEATRGAPAASVQ
jgi:hypothetical protein